MTESILNSTKKILGIDSSYTAFDQDIIMHINSTFATLNQLGVGPVEGFMISNSTPVWNDILDSDLRLNSVKSYVYLRVRLLFDPPSTSYAMSAIQDQITELGWRISTYREEEGWTPPIQTETTSEE
jgi:hypothetical protein